MTAPRPDPRPGRPDRRWLRLMLAALVAAVAVLGAPAVSATAEPAEVVKYYVVQPSFQGAPESLWDIAGRLLGSGRRYPEIYQLNAGREQPDGGQLSDPTRLTAGWLLILPWDAAGDGVHVGTLPDALAAAPSASPATVPAAAATSCAIPAEHPLGSVPWAQLRLAPDRAWTVTRGAGVVVAAVDTGVDTQVPGLAGRVVPGLDLVGAGHDPIDCSGHGTATAGIVVAQPRVGTGLVGIAPQAAILPVKTRVSRGVIAAGDAALAITEAASSGARVIMVPAVVDLSAPVVATAVADAVARDIVVVLAAANTAPASTSLVGVLRVAAVRADDQLLSTGPPGSVDVVAPGQNIVTLSAGGSGEVAGSGSDFAVPFVAGVAALVRAAAPELSAAQVVQRIEQTAQPVGAATRPDSGYGWGLIDPGAAVLAAPADSDTATGQAGPGRAPVVAAVAGCALVLAAWVFVWYRRRVPRTGDGAA